MTVFTIWYRRVLEQIQDRFRADWDAFGALLPGGTELVADPTKAAPQFRYFAGVINFQLAIFPQEPRCAAPAYVPAGDDGGFGVREAARFKNVFANTTRSGVSFESFGLAVPVDATWPADGAPADDTAIVLRGYVGKDVVHYVDRRQGRVKGIIKLPFNAAAQAGCKREMRMLETLATGRRGVAPKPLAIGRLPGAGGKPGQFFTMQTFLAGSRPKSMRMSTLDGFLGRLALPGETITLAGLAADLRHEIAALNVSRRSKDRIAALLNRVTDTTELPAAIGHGDCWEDNFILTRDGGLSAVDWENSHAKWLSFLDLVQAAVCACYLDPDISAFAGIFAAEKMSVLKRQYAARIPRGGPTLDEILTFHVCHHYVDRLAVAGSLNRPGLRHLDDMIHSELPF
jgi:hypothetical protein